MLWPTLVFALAAVVQAPPPQTISFETADGARIAADIYGKGPDAVVLAHGAAFNKESWQSLAETLSARGHRVMAIDFRGYGGSTLGREDKALYQDVLAAVRFLRASGATTVSVVGASMGGGASARAAVAAKPGEVDRLFLLSPVAIETPEAMKAGRLLYLASRDEPLAPSIQQQYERAPEPKRLVLLDGNAHAQNIFKTNQAARLTALIVEFLDKRSKHP